MASSGRIRDISDEIEQLRILYEQTWGKPTSPQIEQLLEKVSQEERTDLLRELLHVEFEFVQRNSSEVLIDEYLARFPDYESVVMEVAGAVGQYAVFQRPNIEGFTILDEIGRGGMGIVYRARHDKLNRLVAIKIINRRMLDQPESLSRFERELAMIGQFRHPNIVEAMHADMTPDGSPYLVMELVEGMTLTEWSKQNPPRETVCIQEAETTIDPKTKQDSGCSEQKPTQTLRRPTTRQRMVKKMESQRIAEACAIVRDTARGLQAIHAAGLVHRDIKPGNLMLLPNGRVKILDLGLAKLREQLAGNSTVAKPHTLQGHFLGTPGYMAPEQMHSAANVDIRADIYSLGCTFYFLLYGRTPTENQSHELASQLPKPLRKILDRMLAADPASRFQTPGEIVEALDVFLGVSKKAHLVNVTAATIIAVFCVVLTFFVLPRAPDIQSDPPQPPPVSMEMIQETINLRYQGNNEQASEDLYKLETSLRDNPFDGSNELLAEVLSAQGDCEFYSGLASDALPEGKFKRLVTRYDEALRLAGESSNALRIRLLCKLVVMEGMQNSGTGDDVTVSRLDTIRRLLSDEQNAGKNGLSLYLHLAEAIMASGENDEPLRDFAKQFELSMEPGLMTREALDLRLFALERLIHHDIQSDRGSLPKDLALLDRILLARFPVLASSVFLNRFFDMAIRACDPNDFDQLAMYLCRLHSVSYPKGSTLVLIYFSPWNNSNGFAVYYPAERQESSRFELPYSRRDVKDAIKQGDSLQLEETLVELIRRNLRAGVPVDLSWEDIPCRPRRIEAFTNEDWPFGESITIEEMLGQLK